MAKGNNGKKNDDKITRELEDALRKSLFGINEVEKQDLYNAAVAMKEIYDNLIEVGFNEKQAIMLVAQMASSGSEK